VSEATQTAPFPDALRRLVANLRYRPGWAFSLGSVDRGQGSAGLTFVVTSLGYDTYNPERGETYRVRHYFPVPPAAYNERSWRRWLLDRLVEVERPYAPQHGPGNDPYIVFEQGSDVERRTTSRGEVQPE
jgi:hypothetical protein